MAHGSSEAGKIVCGNLLTVPALSVCLLSPTTMIRVSHVIFLDVHVGGIWGTTFGPLNSIFRIVHVV